MYLRTLLIVLLLALLAGFAALNWSAVMQPTPLSLGFAAVEAPLGLILLGMFAALTLLFLIYIVYLQSSVMFEGRRHARQLQAQRELADQAEASRFSQLRTFLEAELGKLHDKNDATTVELTARMDRLERDLRTTVEHSGNALAASLGELEDRFEQMARK
ncbi:MAG: LapA family protein [Deltaproteobacteria bacterium]|nr:LapA family protein [Deltaproteobacteria bacterium]MBM4298803.1 LapA family protein [Deltaproteobacteria bacterium]